MIKLDLFDVFSSRGRVLNKVVEIKLDNFDRTGVSYPVKDLSNISLKFENIDDGKVKVNAFFDITLLIPCDRCLKDVEEKLNCEYETILMTDEVRESEDDADELSYFEGHEFYVDEFVSLIVLMNMPSKVLCCDDCKGLCPVCGNNLNEHDCGCDSFVPDPRMARIADIFNASKEV